MSGNVVWGIDFAARNRPEPIRTREDAVDHLASELSKMLDEGDTLMVLECQNGETLSVHSDGRRVEMPADCPA